MRGKKIFIILPHLGGGGTERTHLYLMNNWSQNGFKIFLILMKKEGHLLSLLNSNITIINLNVNRIRKIIFPVLKLINYYKPHIILAPMWPITSAVTISWLISFKTGKLFLADHNPIIKEWAYDLNINWYFFKLTYNLTYPLATGIIAVSKQIKKDILRISLVKKTNIKVIYNPVKFFNFNNFEQKKTRIKLFGNFKFCLIAVGTLKKSRDFITLIRAFSIFKYKNTSKLIILGEGPERINILNFVKKNNLENNVELKGFMKNPYPWIACADVYIHSSLYDGLPLVIIESLACGTKIVSTDCESGPREILDYGKYGMLIPIKDPEKMAKSIEKSIEKNINKSFLIDRSKIFSIENISKNYLNYFF